MRKVVLILGLFMTTSIALTSCRDDRSGVERAADDIEDAVDDIGDEIDDTFD